MNRYFVKKYRPLGDGVMSFSELSLFLDKEGARRCGAWRKQILRVMGGGVLLSVIATEIRSDTPDVIETRPVDGNILMDQFEFPVNYHLFYPNTLRDGSVDQENASRTESDGEKAERISREIVSTNPIKELAGKNEMPIGEKQGRFSGFLENENMTIFWVGDKPFQNGHHRFPTVGLVRLELANSVLTMTDTRGREKEFRIGESLY